MEIILRGWVKDKKIKNETVIYFNCLIEILKMCFFIKTGRAQASSLCTLMDGLVKKINQEGMKSSEMMRWVEEEENLRTVEMPRRKKKNGCVDSTRICDGDVFLLGNMIGQKLKFKMGERWRRFRQSPCFLLMEINPNKQQITKHNPNKNYI